MENWRAFLLEMTLASTLPATSDKPHPFYTDIIDGIEAATKVPATEEEKEEPTKPTKTKPTGIIKSSCRCVDSSESALSVRDIKQKLNQYYKNSEGYEALAVDGTCDRKTQETIRQFQADTKIEQDGCVGDETEGAMVKAGILNALTKPSSSSKTQKRPSESESEKEEQQPENTQDNTQDNTSFDSSVSGNFSSGVTISIKSNKAAHKKPHSVVGPNHHGYGRDSHGDNPNTENDAYMVNPVWFGDKLPSSEIGIYTRFRPIGQYGNPRLAAALSAAADKTKGLGRDGQGIALVTSVSRGGPNFPCYNQKEIDKNPSIPCIQGGWGIGSNNTGEHRYGHQSGLEADVTYYKSTGSSQYWNAVGKTQKGKRYIKSAFDYERNCMFIETLCAMEEIELVLVGRYMRDIIRDWVRSNGKEKKYPLVLSSKKFQGDSSGGHNDHFHIRMKFKDDAPNMRDYLANRMKFAEVSSNTLASSPMQKKTKGTRGFQNLISKSLKEIVELYPNKSQLGFVFGTIDGTIITQYNQDSVFYGASMPKTMLGLAHLVTFKGPARISNRELTGMLTYWKRSKGGYPGSNEVARGISSRFTGSTARIRRDGLGKLTPAQVAAVSEKFGIKNSTFQFGGGMNKQTPKDTFLFFAGLARMDQEKFRSNDPLKDFYLRNKKSVKLLISTQRKRTYKYKLKCTGAVSRPHWGKGGLYNGAVHFAFVIDGKYVISVFTQNKPGVPKSDPDRQRKRAIINAEGYDLMNAVIYKFIQEIDSRK